MNNYNKKLPVQFHIKKLYRKKFDKLFLGKSLDLKTINQGGVPSEITRITFFIRVAKVKLLTCFTKQKVKLRKFGKNLSLLEMFIKIYEFVP